METSTTNPSTTDTTSSTSTSTTTTTDTGTGSTGTSVDITPILNNQKSLIFLSSFENTLLFALIVFLAFDKVLGRFLKK